MYARVMEDAGGDGGSGGGSSNPLAGFGKPEGSQPIDSNDGGDNDQNPIDDKGGKGDSGGGSATDGGEGGAGGAQSFVVPEGLNPVWASIAAMDGEGFELPPDIKPENELSYMERYFQNNLLEKLPPLVRDIATNSLKNPAFDVESFVGGATAQYNLDSMSDKDAIIESLILKGKLDVNNPEHKADIDEIKEYVEGMKKPELMDKGSSAKAHLSDVNKQKADEYTQRNAAQFKAQIDQLNAKNKEFTQKAYEAMKGKTELFGMPVNDKELESVRDMMEKLYTIDDNGESHINKWFMSMTPDQIFEFLYMNIKGNKGFSDYVKGIKDSAGKAIFEKLDLMPTSFSSRETSGSQATMAGFGKPERR